MSVLSFNILNSSCESFFISLHQRVVRESLTAYTYHMVPSLTHPIPPAPDAIVHRRFFLYTVLFRLHDILHSSV